MESFTKINSIELLFVSIQSPLQNSNPLKGRVDTQSAIPLTACLFDFSQDVSATDIIINYDFDDVPFEKAALIKKNQSL